MKEYSTREAAKKLGLSLLTIQRYIAANKIPVPPVRKLGGGKFRVWTDQDIEKVREMLPKIANGRKTRYQKKQSAVGAQQSPKTKAQPGAAVPHESGKPKKKK